jgi:voltage-gated sodium channel
LLLAIIFHIGSVVAIEQFGSEFPEWFGSLPASAYSVFQIMTSESWSMGIVWPMMDVYPEEAMRKLAVLEKKLPERQ